ncbi:predicted protein [Naegleria gruberi]|uniref:Predicted protein n=1 Tax=Naegleria gruberi TaxID=5762 RepID=D2VXW1_NAEGR|nr:uncharacterized protein NAEGRDRAFT_73897 [Naegleria gruberi]EFC38409.1 predicted protein [Naegleria gruberi]|eukprot:XP_002671153.1 predicted protein [Naegleria gruberi strain NEG-M]
MLTYLYSLNSWQSFGLILLLTVISLVSYFAFRLYKQYSKVSNIPGVFQLLELSPFRIPLLSPYYYFGSVKEIENVVDSYSNDETKTARIVTKDAPIVLISDPKLFKEFFILKANCYEKPDFKFITMFGENIVSAVNNERWKRHFKVCSPAFSPQNLIYVCQVACQSAELLFERWSKDESGVMLSNDDFSDITLDVLGKAGFNLDFGIFSSNQEGKAFKTSLQQTFSMKALAIRRLFGNGKLQTIMSKIVGIHGHLETCSKSLDEMIQSRKKLLEDKPLINDMNDILTLLVKANMTEKLITDDELKSNSVIMSFAGHDTTSTLLQWTTFEISKNPTIQQELYNEISKTIGRRDPTIDDFPNLHLVNSVLMESFRLHPAVQILSRVAVKNTTLGNFSIPKGTHVATLFGYLMKRPDVWEKPTEFIADRFVDPQFRESSFHNFTFVPFSMGNRACLGKKFSLLESCMILTKMIQRFEFELLNDLEKDPIVAIQSPVHKPSPNLKVRITRRVTPEIVSAA